MQTILDPAARPTLAAVAPRRTSSRLGAADVALVAILTCVAAAVRWPYLWTIPRFTDETLEVLHSLAIVRDGTRPLTNYDSYYGALYNYVVALGLWISGESPFAPRAVVIVAAIFTVGATYGLARELAVGAGDHFVAGPWPSRAVGVLAASMLATNGQHVVVNSHIAWSNCLTPLFTTLAFWALLRATRPPQRRAGLALASAGLLLGLSLQTHPLVVTFLPGIALGVLWRRWRIVATPWPYLAAALLLVGYGNVVAYNVGNGFESFTSARRMSGEYAQDQQATNGYAPTVMSMGLMLARSLGGAVDQRDSTLDYLADPLVAVVCALAAGGLLRLAWRGLPLPLVVVLSALLLLPAVNSKFGTLLTSRYLMPLVPLLFAAAAVTWVGLAYRLRLFADARPSLRVRAPLAIWLLAGAVLVLAPLASLGRYYERALARTDTNERILRLADEIAAARGPAEPVLIDEAIGSELPDTGVTELRGFEHLLVFARVPYRVVRPTPGRVLDELDADRTALAVLNARDAAAIGGRLALTPLDPRPPVGAGRMTDYRLYRVARRRAVRIAGRPRRLARARA